MVFNGNIEIFICVTNMSLLICVMNMRCTGI